MQWLKATGCLLLTAVLLSAPGCGGGGQHTQLRVLQGSADAGSVNVLVDGTTLFSNVAFAAPTKYAEASPGSRHLQVQQAGSSTSIIDQTVSLNGGANYTLITANFVSNITPLFLTDDTAAPGAGKIQLRLVNDMPSVGSIDVYVVTPGTLPGTVLPTISNLGLDSVTAYQSLSAGTYEVIVTGVGNVFTYLDTGPITFTAGQNRTIVLMSNLSGYGSVTLADLN